ncbi:membrane protein [Streptomyces noursei ZPM]|uniref:Uncharacterized protein n=1 Tax=Streptomyces noursei TaxID=1971 RepID=A0A401R7Z0_STRNR|nr:hypothetical protein [Streptomyces noursei]AKA06178.1 membrane protein [Streptomyces noursei ZPM]EOT02736.1 hypothetical protein K530_17244 [Streptomyces noursei CCRC 11814]EXU89242.1 hypothetical protein P354_23930 [Streptomyces noursei PD-1]UWS74565.1 hypothetical protein N1H47_26940 [Streptomyces noursei]GCB93749.1 hypothetical protein SALB_06535 [Streptomyces noursei]
MGTTTDKRTDDATNDDAAATVVKTTAVEGDGAPETTTDGTEETGKAKGEAGKAPAGGEGSDTAPATTTDADADAASDTDAESDADADADAEDATPEEPAAAGAAAGAGAVVAAGLGLASVTGTWLSTLLAERQTLLGQIKLQSGKATDQIAAVYGAPWHTTALVNGVFAVLAMLVAAVVLTGRRPAWVRAVAWGGLVLGLLGLVISAGMYLDLFASMPSLPKGAGGGA